MTAALVERALEGEMSEHLGYARGDPAGQGTGNSRNGKGRKTVQTEQGEVTIEVPVTVTAASSVPPVSHFEF